MVYERSGFVGVFCFVLWGSFCCFLVWGVFFVLWVLFNICEEQWSSVSHQGLISYAQVKCSPKAWVTPNQPRQHQSFCSFQAKSSKPGAESCAVKGWGTIWAGITPPWRCSLGLKHGETSVFIPSASLSSNFIYASGCHWVIFRSFQGYIFLQELFLGALPNWKL